MATSNQEDIEIRERRLRERTRLLWGKFLSALKDVITLRNITNVVFILGVSGICFHQCYLQVDEYLRYKTRIQISHQFPSSTLWLAPGVTVCNNNRLRLDRLTEYEPSLKKVIEQILSGNSSSASSGGRRSAEKMRQIKNSVDNYVNISKIINESSMLKLMNLSRAPIIKDINCNTAWGAQINCENIRIVESYQASQCNTAFYLGSLLRALASGAAYDFNSSFLGGGRKVLPFDSHEIADILVDFDPEQHADFHRDIGGKIVIHSTAHIGSIRDVAHAILPGNKYEIIVQRVMSQRLPPPYESMCFNYKKNNSYLFTERENTAASVELDKTVCTRNCILRKTTKECNCWPVEVPFFPGDDKVANSDSYKMCPWGYEEALIGSNYSADIHVNCYRRYHAECRALCRLGCRTEDYKLHVMSNPWPSSDKFYLARNEKARRELRRLRGCCAMISIKYLEYMEKRHIMYPQLTLAQMVSNIGGIVSALIGVSTVTIYRYITKHVLRCKIVSDYRPTGGGGDGGGGGGNWKTNGRADRGRSKSVNSIKSTYTRRSRVSPTNSTLSTLTLRD